MSEHAIPPPPPPPLSQTGEKLTPTANVSTKRINSFHHNENACEWASSISELRAACQKYEICLYSEPPYWHYTNFESMLQEGPTCGLVALSMLLQKSVMPSDILQMAKDFGYTNNGEMFSVKNMLSLLEHLVKKANVEGLFLKHCRDKISKQSVIESLVNGSIMLVPYDADRNHSPCRKNGHSAHWALVTGVLITEATRSKDAKYNCRNVYVTAKHGKSLHLAIWKLQDLDESNRNLNEMSEKRVNDELDYVLPEGGVSGDNGLNGQFILINKISR